MKPTNRAVLGALAAASCLFPFSPFAAELKPVRVLVLTGQNNHDWKATTVAIREVLGRGDRFAVSVTEHPERCDSSSLEAYDVLVSNWNTFGDGAAVKEWPEATRRAVVEFVRRGRGFVVVHSGSSSFPEWAEYQQLAGASWGPRTGHGAAHTFRVKISDADHPVTRMLAHFSTTDELWHSALRQPDVRVLATAYSAPEHGGSGKDEPVALVTGFGEGRGFTLLLGHDGKAMESAGFQALLRRGTEWAATGKVTLEEGTVPFVTKPAWEALPGYRFGQSRAPLLLLAEEAQIASSHEETAEPLARRYEALLESDASLEARQFACEQLSVLGCRRSVQTVDDYLLDPGLEVQARQALERIGGKEAMRALRDALKQAGGRSQTALILSIAKLRDEDAVDQLAGILNESGRPGDQDARALAAIYALGEIGGDGAVRALSEAGRSMPGAFQVPVGLAEVRCAEHWVSSGQDEKALGLLAALVGPGRPAPVRRAAFPPYLACAGGKAEPALRDALKNGDAALREGALRAVAASRDPGSIAIIAGAFSALDVESQVKALSAFEHTTVAAAISVVESSLASPESAVRLAATQAAGTIPVRSLVQALLRRQRQAEPAERKALLEALAACPAPGAEDEILSVLERGGPTPDGLAGVLAARGARGAVPLMSELARTGAPGTRREALRALGQLADDSWLEQGITLLEANPDDSDEIEAALAGVCRRTGKVDALVSSLATGAPAVVPSLLDVLAALGDNQALPTIFQQLEKPEFSDAAVRALASWPKAAPMQGLADFARRTSDPRRRILAIRGVAALSAPAGGDRATAANPTPLSQQTVGVLVELIPVAPLSEQKMLLSALSGIGSVPALKAVAAQLETPGLTEDAARSVLALVEKLGVANVPDPGSLLQKVRAAAQAEDLKSRAAEWLAIASSPNLARGANAVSLDGLQPDGEGGGPMAAIDGNLETYWDETDNQSRYILRVDLPRKARLGALRIVGWKHHEFAPRDFEVFCDATLARKVADAAYRSNCLVLDLGGAECQSVELRISRAYGASPAIRELELYEAPAPAKP